MPEDGPFKLDGDIVWFKNGVIHRSDGPAMELKNGDKVWALNGKVVSEQEVIAQHEADLREARQLRDKMLKSSEAEQLSEYHTGLKKPPKLMKPLKYEQKPKDP